MDTRICRKCQEEKDVEKFRRREVKGKQYVDNICMACRGTRERATMRLRMLEAFGWKCSCCGEGHPDFLTLEHKLGSNHYGFEDSSTHIKNRQQLIREAEKENWNPEKYDLLCINCNWAKGQYGECPHRSGITAEQRIEKLKTQAIGIGFNHRNLRGSEAGWFKKGFDGRRPSEREST